MLRLPVEGGPVVLTDLVQGMQAAEDEGEPMVALGQGSMDHHGLAKASQAEWFIVELDSVAPDVDMLDALEQSYQYLVSEGLARGSR